MNSRKQVAAALLVAALILGGLTLLGTYRAGAYPGEGPDDTKQAGGNKPRPAGTLPSAGRREEEQRLRKTIQAYCDAFNKNDLDGLMACWTEDAEYTNEAGKAYRGREMLRTLLKRALSDHKGSKQTIEVRSVRFIRPEVAVEEGRVIMTSPEGTTAPGRYSAVWVKQNGKWLVSCVRDLPEPVDEEKPAAARKLEALAWMIGEWRNKAGKDDVRMTCKWAPNQSFLLQEFTGTRADGKEVAATQRIGWDPHNQRIRSWVFDSVGGFGEGAWARHGNTWVVDCEGVFPDGRIATSINRWKYIDENTMEWSSTEREASESPLPDLNVTFVRKAKGH